MKDSSQKYYITFHGHFYQPPRENPWIESIEKQGGAYPFHDWNERVAYECYIPNASARVKDEYNSTIDIVNNYAYINFNFGPTLLYWYEKNFPEQYYRLIEADKESRVKYNGHGNAIAQIYNHIIMPLATSRDKLTQAKWGIVDFKYRFGRFPEAIWLPEMACNYATVEILIELGMKYLLLKPDQAEKVRPLGEKSWSDVSAGSIDTRRAYKLFLKDEEGKVISDKFINVFFYNNELSSQVAFGDILRDSVHFADRIMNCFDKNLEEPQLVHIVTDGESYGHHKSFAEMCLARLVKYELPKRGIVLSNYAQFLEISPASWEVEIKRGRNNEGTSWSCIHGVDRWKVNCGCTSSSRPGWTQTWRAPLRAALDRLRAEIDSIFEEIGQEIFLDPWQARDDYIEIILERSPEKISYFMKEHLKSEPTPESQLLSLKLLEMQRHAMLMYTSCGWFFADIAGLETVQNLKYTARAIQLAKEISGRNLEVVFFPLLKKAKSNLVEYKNGWEVYEKLVQPSIVEAERVASQYGICFLFEGDSRNRIYHYQIKKINGERKSVAGIDIAVGRLLLTSGITFEVKGIAFFVIHLPDHTIHSYLAETMEEESYQELINKVLSLSGQELLRGIDEIRKPYFGDNFYTLKDLFVDERERIFSLIVQGKMEKFRSIYSTIFAEYFPVLEGFYNLELPAPPNLQSEIEIAVSRIFSLEIKELAESFQEERLDWLRELTEKIKSYQLKIDYSLFDKSLKDLIIAKIKVLSEDLRWDNLRHLKALVEMGLSLQSNFWRYEAESRIFDLLSSRIMPLLSSLRKKDLEEETQKLIEEFFSLMASLDFRIDYYQQIFNEKKQGIF